MKMIRWAKPLLALAIASAACVAFQASAQVYVRGYTRADGTYVQGYYRTSPNSTRMDNYSTQGNINPYTGAVGTRSPYTTPQVQLYTPNIAGSAMKGYADGQKARLRRLEIKRLQQQTQDGGGGG